MNKKAYGNLPVIGGLPKDGELYERFGSILIFCRRCSGHFECDNRDHYNLDTHVHIGDRDNALRCSRFIEATGRECGSEVWDIRPTETVPFNERAIRRYRRGH